MLRPVSMDTTVAYLVERWMNGTKAAKQLVEEYVSSHLDSILGYVIVLWIVKTAFRWILRTRCTPALSTCKPSKGPTRDPMCSYCWDDLRLEDDTIVHIPCNNSWHRHCLEEVVQSTTHGLVLCPICRRILNQDEFLIIGREAIRLSVLDELCTRACKVGWALIASALAIVIGNGLGQSAGIPFVLLKSSDAATLAFVFVQLAAYLETFNFLIRLLGLKSQWRSIRRLLFNTAGFMALSATGLVWEVLRPKASTNAIDWQERMLNGRVLTKASTYGVIIIFLTVKVGVVPELMWLLAWV